MSCHIDWPKIFILRGGDVIPSPSEASSPKTLNSALDTEDEGTIISRNACNCLPVATG